MNRCAETCAAVMSRELISGGGTETAEELLDHFSGNVEAFSRLLTLVLWRQSAEAITAIYAAIDAVAAAKHPDAECARQCDEDRAAVAADLARV